MLSYQAMLDRCFRPANIGWETYGGRGITVCKRWQGKRGFINFLADMGVRPEGKTLDRKNPDSNYTSRNCKWSSRRVQQNNRRCSKMSAKKLKELEEMESAIKAEEDVY